MCYSVLFQKISLCAFTECLMNLSWDSLLIWRCCSVTILLLERFNACEISLSHYVWEALCNTPSWFSWVILVESGEEGDAHQLEYLPYPSTAYDHRTINHVNNFC